MSHGCRNLGALTREAFEKRYTQLDIIGSGAEGIIYRAIDNVTNSLVALKIADEMDISCQFEQIRMYTGGVVEIKEYGSMNRRVWEDEEEDEEYGSEEDSVFYTMPILESVAPMLVINQLSVLFELLLTVVVLNMHGIVHGDLHAGNILFERVNYKRQYTINDRTYIASFEYMPVIIDFGMGAVGPPLKEFSKIDLWKLVGVNEDMEFTLEDFATSDLLHSIVTELRTRAQFTILLHPIFAPLTDSPIESGDLVKVFAPFNIQN